MGWVFCDTHYSLPIVGGRAKYVFIIHPLCGTPDLDSVISAGYGGGVTRFVH